METINCKACKEVISQHAEECPHCGKHPTKKANGMAKTQTIVLLAVIVIAAIAGLTSIL